jgi:hypothetical protein
LKRRGQLGYRGFHVGDGSSAFIHHDHAGRDGDQICAARFRDEQSHGNGARDGWRIGAGGETDIKAQADSQQNQAKGERAKCSFHSMNFRRPSLLAGLVYGQSLRRSGDHSKPG